MKKLILACVFAAMLGGLAACSGQAEQPSQGEQPPTKTTEQGSIWIKGSGSQTSDWFIVDKDEWTIDWACLVDPEYKNDDAVFDFYIYPRGETLDAIKTPRLFIGNVVDFVGSRHLYADAGEYYIRVEAIGIQCWKIVISSPENQ